MSSSRLPRFTAATVGLVMAVTAVPAAAVHAAAPDSPVDTVGENALTPILPREWEPAAATPAQEIAGSPTITPADGTRIAGRETLAASSTSSTDPLASLAVNGDDVPAAPTLGDGEASFQVNVGSNSMSRGYSNYLVVNGTRITILETYASTTTDISVPYELLVHGENTITLGAGPRPSSCGMNYDDFVLDDFRLALADGTEIRDDANPSDITIGDGNCGSNETRPRSIDLTFTIGGEPGADAGLLHVLDTTQLPDGAHEVTASTAGGATTTHGLVVDNTGPALIDSTPAAGSVLIGDVALDARVADEAGVRGTPTLTLDGGVVAVGDTISSDDLAAGEHELVVEAEDELGNTARHVVSFTTSPNSANVGAMSPQSGSSEEGSDVTLHAEVVDPNGSDLEATFYAANPTFPDAAYEGTAQELPVSQLDFTGQTEADTVALRPGDGEVLRSPAAEGVTYQRFDVPVEAAADDELVVSWSGEVDPARGVRLHVWNTEKLVWEKATDVRGTADGPTEASGTAGVEHVDGAEVHLLVEGYDPFADDIAEDPDEAFRDPGTYDFSLVHNTDTQYLSEGATERESAEERAAFAQAYRAIPEWIVDNADERNIAYAFHSGDITENHFLLTDNEDWNAQVRAEWEFADEMQSILDDAGIPNGVLSGNHDNVFGADEDLYNEYFGPERYEALSDSWENAEYGAPWREGDNSNHYDLFSAGGLDFIALHLAYYVTDEELIWADEILSQYPDRNAIIASHDYLGASSAPDGRGAGYASPDGQPIFDSLVSQHSNVFLVLSGHVSGVGTNVLTDVAEPGHNVVEMLADYQAYEVDGERMAGFFRFLQFDVDRSEMTVDTYSPWMDNHGATEFDPASRYDGREDEFTVPVNLTSRTTSIATDAVSVAVLSDDAIGSVTVASGEAASAEWTGLEPGETYGWYVVAENATEGRAVSPLATFTTGGEPGEPEEPTQRFGFFLNDGWDGVPEHVFQYGRFADEVLIGDWDGDGADSITMRRGNTFHVSNEPHGGAAEIVFTYGRADDVVLVGDWDGDGIDTLAVRRGSEYHVMNSLRGGDADQVISYGRADDEVMVGDWDADATDTFAVRRGTNFHVKNTIAGGDADHVFTFGREGDVTLAGDWDGDGHDTFAVRRGKAYHVNNSLTGGEAELAISYGRVGDEVYVGDWNGDGRDTLGVRRTPDGVS
ncbi:hypothetical protein V2J52_04795 [Georgenia sp. MJ173]|uniref:hypothetical protein n=1 Tax=Georgenia sunbinii TaxID=3117728 RepID=UPI002F26663E